jgi:hypothetical protein
VIAAAVLVGFVSLVFLHSRGWSEIYTSSSVRGLGISAVIATLFGAWQILMVWIYNNAGKSLFAMALTHWTFGLFWSLWPTENLHRVVSFYDPRIMAFVAISYGIAVVLRWGPRTLAHTEGRAA